MEKLRRKDSSSGDGVRVTANACSWVAFVVPGLVLFSSNPTRQNQALSEVSPCPELHTPFTHSSGMVGSDSCASYRVAESFVDASFYCFSVESPESPRLLQYSPIPAPVSSCCVFLISWHLLKSCSYLCSLRLFLRIFYTDGIGL